MLALTDPPSAPTPPLVADGRLEALEPIAGPSLPPILPSPYGSHSPSSLPFPPSSLPQTRRSAGRTGVGRATTLSFSLCFAELLRKNGELLLVRAAPTDVANAEECFRQALEWGRRQDALSWELRSATSLAHLYHRQGRTTQARKVLTPVYRRFTEGFETADLLAAKALLDALR